MQFIGERDRDFMKTVAELSELMNFGMWEMGLECSLILVRERATFLGMILFTWLQELSLVTGDQRRGTTTQNPKTVLTRASLSANSSFT